MLFAESEGRIAELNGYFSTVRGKDLRVKWLFLYCKREGSQCLSAARGKGHRVKWLFVICKREGSQRYMVVKVLYCKREGSQT